MTLITCVFPEVGSPFLFGDLLTTTAPEYGRALSLPFLDGPVEFRHAGRALAGVQQKCIVVSPKLAVAWSGPRYVAKLLFKHIPDDLANEPDTDKLRAYLNWFVDEYNPREPLSHIWLFSEEGSMSRIGFGTARRDTKVSNVISAGSGDYYFYEMLDEISQLIAMEGESVSQHDLYIHFLGKIILTSAMEMFDKSTLDFHFGGGFELITRLEKGLSKIPYNIILWSWDDGGMHLHGPIFAFNYVSDHLLVTKIELERDMKATGSRFLVEDFLERTPIPTFEEAVKAPFSNNVHYHIVVNQLERQIMPLFIEFGSKDFQLINGSDNETLRIVQNDDFLRRLHGGVRAVLERDQATRPLFWL